MPNAPNDPMGSGAAPKNCCSVVIPRHPPTGATTPCDGPEPWVRPGDRGSRDRETAEPCRTAQAPIHPRAMRVHTTAIRRCHAADQIIRSLDESNDRSSGVGGSDDSMLEELAEEDSDPNHRLVTPPTLLGLFGAPCARTASTPASATQRMEDHGLAKDSPTRWAFEASSDERLRWDDLWNRCPRAAAHRGTLPRRSGSDLAWGTVVEPAGDAHKGTSPAGQAVVGASRSPRPDTIGKAACKLH